MDRLPSILSKYGHFLTQQFSGIIVYGKKILQFPKNLSIHCKVWTFVLPMNFANICMKEKRPIMAEKRPCIESMGVLLTQQFFGIFNCLHDICTRLRNFLHPPILRGRPYMTISHRFPHRFH